MSGEGQYYLTMALTGVGTFVLAAFAFVIGFNNRVTEAFNLGREAKDRAEENKRERIRLEDQVNTQHISIGGRFDMLSRDFHAMELEMHSKLASLSSLAESTARSVAATEARIAKGLEDLEKTVQHLSSSMVKTLAELASQHRNG